MYAQLITSINNFKEIVNLANVLDLLLFLLLTFLGVAARVSIDIEINKKRLKDIKFFNRYFLATVLAYVIELYLSQNNFFRKHYAEIIILFCIFVNDIIEFILSNKTKLFNYLLNAFLKGAGDLKNTLNKDKNTNDTSTDESN